MKEITEPTALPGTQNIMVIAIDAACLSACSLIYNFHCYQVPGIFVCSAGPAVVVSTSIDFFQHVSKRCVVFTSNLALSMYPTIPSKPSVRIDYSSPKRHDCNYRHKFQISRQKGNGMPFEYAWTAANIVFP